MRLFRSQSCSLASGAILVATAIQAQTQRPVRLEWRMPDGVKRVAVLETTLTQEMEANGLTIKTSVKQTLVSSAQAGQRGADGRLPITHQVESLKATMTLPLEVSVTYDSTKEFKKQGTLVDSVLDSLHAFSSAKWTTIVDEEFKAVAVVGNDELLATLAPDVQQGLRNQLSDEALLRSHNELIDSMPRDAISKGQKWTRTHFADFDLGQVMAFEKEFRYEGVVKVDGRIVDKISQRVVKVSLTVGDNPLGVKLTENDLRVDSSEGVIYFDRQNGWIYQSHEKTKISGSMSFEVRKKLTKATVQLSITNRMTVR